MLQSRIIYSVTFYILLIILISILKPEIMFNKDGDIISFGLNKNETLYSFGVFSVLSAIVTFYLFCIIDLIFG